MHRIKSGKEYYVLPGGSIKKGENPLQAVIRETKEETSLKVEIDSLLWEITEDVGGKERRLYIFLAKTFSGKLKIGSPEKERQGKDNLYELEWIALKDLKKIELYSKSLKSKIRKEFL